MRWRPSLLTKFGVISACSIALLGVVLAHSEEQVVRDRAEAAARDISRVGSVLAARALLSPADVENGTPPARSRVLDMAVRMAGDGQQARVTVWNRKGVATYSDDPAVVGTKLHRQALADRALAGTTSYEVVTLNGHDAEAPGVRGRMMVIFVPMQFDDRPLVSGVLEAFAPYAPVEAAVRSYQMHIYLVIGGGLGLLWLLLLKVVGTASRRLRRQANDNEFLALHDTLTGLPNRTLFYDRARQALAVAKRSGNSVGILIGDLDRFKEINDTLGHHTGDQLLQEVSTRLAGELRPMDTVARLGGDEFAILLPEINDLGEAIIITDRLLAALARPIVLGDLTVETDASFGLVTFPEFGDDVETLLQHADVAMYAAKEQRSGYAVYAADQDRYSPQRLALMTELRRAVEGGAIGVHYQPKADLQSGIVTGVEALARWNHPEHGNIPPDEFIPLAEHTGLIQPLTAHVLRTSIRDCRRWHDLGHEFSVSVNLSARNLVDVDLPDEVALLLAEHRLPASALVLEITESTIMADPARALVILDRLHEMGVGLAIDDYGTGYSSLAYLRRLPVTELKVDRSFVMQMTESESDAVIVRSTIDLGRNLGLCVVAEGVETEEAWQSLATLGCDQAQGYLLSRPVPLVQLLADLTDPPWQVRHGDPVTVPGAQR